jgi:hypothetical protein
MINGGKVYYIFRNLNDNKDIRLNDNLIRLNDNLIRIIQQYNINVFSKIELLAELKKSIYGIYWRLNIKNKWKKIKNFKNKFECKNYWAVVQY